DVAHSFWVPRLAGKTDVIPNKKNTMWIDPHVPGTYLGQWAEFCGTEHAMMLLRVVVESRSDFDSWVATQKRQPKVDPAAPASCPQALAATARINFHTLPGTVADAPFGPDLSHLMARETIGSGVAMNTRDHLRIWVANPNVMKPGARMPAMGLDNRDLDALVD